MAYFPPGSAMATRFAKKQTRSVPGTVIGKSQLKSVSTSYQAPVPVQSNTYVEPEKPVITMEPVQVQVQNEVQEEVKITSEDQAKIDKYNQDLKKYNEELDAYNKAKAEYDAQVAAYNKEKDDWYLAQKLIDKGKEYAASGDKSVQSKIKFLAQASSAARNAQFTAIEQGKPVPTNFTFSSGGYSTSFKVDAPITDQIKTPVIPEGFQGVSDPNAPGGLRLEKIPTTYQVINPTVYPTVQELSQGPVTPLTSFVQSTPVQPVMTQTQTPIAQNVIGITPSSATIKEPAKVSFEQSNLYNTLESQKQSVMNTNILTVSKAPSSYQQLQSDIKSQGFIQGPITFVGSKLSGAYDFAQQKGYTSSYQQEGVRNLLQAAPSSVYLTPVGIPLIAVKGAESLGTISGRTRLNEEVKSRISSGESSNVAYAKAYGQPIFDLVVGGAGTISQIKSLNIAREASQFQKAPTKFIGTLNEETQTLDVIGFKNIPGKTKVTVEKLPFTQTESGIIVEGGTGKTFVLESNRNTLLEFPIGNKISKPGINNIKPQVTEFNIGGRSEIINTEAKIINPKLKQTSMIDNIEATRSRIYTEPIVKKQTLIEYPIGNKISKPGQAIPVKTYENYIGISRENNNIIQSIGAKAEKARMNIESGQISFSGKPSEFGIIKKYVPDTEQGFTTIIGNKPVKSESFSNQFNSLDQLTTQKIKSVPRGSSISSSFIEAGLNIPTPTKSMTVLEQLPKASVYAGTGTYERYSTSENLVPRLKVQTTVQSLGDNQFKNTIPGSNQFGSTAPEGKLNSLGELGRFNNLGTSNSRLDISQPERNIQKPVLDLTNKNKNTEKIKSNLNQTQSSNDLIIQSPRINQDLIQPQKQKQRQEQPQAQNQPQSPRTTTTIQIIETPRPRIRPPLIIPRKVKSESKREILTKAYDVLRRRKGKVEVIGKNLPFYKANKLGSKKVKSDLTQTYALRESGLTSEKDIYYNIPKTLFTAPKLKSTNIQGLKTFTERRGKTLTEGSERSLLQRERFRF